MRSYLLKGNRYEILPSYTIGAASYSPIWDEMFVWLNSTGRATQNAAVRVFRCFGRRFWFNQMTAMILLLRGLEVVIGASGVIST